MCKKHTFIFRKKKKIKKKFTKTATIPAMILDGGYSDKKILKMTFKLRNVLKSHLSQKIVFTEKK